MTRIKGFFRAVAHGSGCGVWRIAALLCLLSLAACSGTGALNALTPDDSYRFDGGLAYGEHPRQRADLYRPRVERPAAGYPVVLFFYGGSWNRGEREQYRFVGEALAARGVLVLIADYRLYPEVRYPEFLVDGAAAVDFALARLAGWGGDPRRVFVMGHSAGGYNAAMLALDPRWLAVHGRHPSAFAGWIGLAGPYDFIPVVNPEVRPVFHHPDTPPESQPIKHTAKVRLPAFIAAASDDKLVNPQRNAVQLADALRAHGAEVTLRLYEDASHTTLIGAFARPLRWLAPVLDDVLAFVGEGRRGDALPGGSPSG